MRKKCEKNFLLMLCNENVEWSDMLTFSCSFGNNFDELKKNLNEKYALNEYPQAFLWKCRKSAINFYVMNHFRQTFHSSLSLSHNPHNLGLSSCNHFYFYSLQGRDRALERLRATSEKKQQQRRREQ